MGRVSGDAEEGAGLFDAESERESPFGQRAVSIVHDRLPVLPPAPGRTYGTPVGSPSVETDREYPGQKEQSNHREGYCQQRRHGLSRRVRPLLTRASPMLRTARDHGPRHREVGAWVGPLQLLAESGPGGGIDPWPGLVGDGLDRAPSDHQDLKLIPLRELTL